MCPWCKLLKPSVCVLVLDNAPYRQSGIESSKSFSRVVCKYISLKEDIFPSSFIFMYADIQIFFFLWSNKPRFRSIKIYIIIVFEISTVRNLSETKDATLQDSYLPECHGMSTCKELSTICNNKLPLSSWSSIPRRLGWQKQDIRVKHR